MRYLGTEGIYRECSICTYVYIFLNLTYIYKQLDLETLLEYLQSVIIFCIQ